jgi:hypothetical protein
LSTTDILVVLKEIGLGGAGWLLFALLAYRVIGILVDVIKHNTAALQKLTDKVDVIILTGRHDDRQ